MDSRRYTPVVSGEAPGESVHSFLALLDPSVAQGDNITGVWYIADGNSWTSWAWTSTDQWEIIEAVKAELDISSAFDDDWAFWEPPPVVQAQAAENRVSYSSGFLAMDPLGASVNSSPDRDTLVATLVRQGYRAADIPLERTAAAPDACSTNEVLDAMRAGVESQANVDGDGEAVATQLVLACQIFCIQWTWTSAGPSPWSGCTFGDFGYVGFIIDGNCRMCRYQAQCDETRTRTRTRRYFDCTTATCNQSQTRTCTVTETCCVPAFEVCPQPAPDANCQSHFGGPTGGTPVCGAASAWAPPCTW